MSVRHFFERPISIKDILGMISDKSYENIVIKKNREDVIFEGKKKDISEFENRIVVGFDIDNKKNLTLYVGSDYNSYYIGVQTWIKRNEKNTPTILYVESIDENGTWKFGNVPMKFDNVNIAYKTYWELVEDNHHAFLIVTARTIYTRELEQTREQRETDKNNFSRYIKEERHDYFILNEMNYNARLEELAEGLAMYTLGVVCDSGRADRADDYIYDWGYYLNEKNQWNLPEEDISKVIDMAREIYERDYQED